MLSAHEKELSCNTLIGIVRACEGKRIQIDLRNELHVYGKVESVFGDMNVTMSNVSVVTPAFKLYEGGRYQDEYEEGDAGKSTCPLNARSKQYDEMTIRGRNIRFVHVPDEIDMVKALQKQIVAITRPNQKKRDKQQFKSRPRNSNFNQNQNKNAQK
jgi:small nuclear ribonucleoprotein (snRNP)-like protein